MTCKWPYRPEMAWTERFVRLKHAKTIAKWVDCKYGYFWISNKLLINSLSELYCKNQYSSRRARTRGFQAFSLICPCSATSIWADSCLAEEIQDKVQNVPFQLPNSGTGFFKQIIWFELTWQRQHISLISFRKSKITGNNHFWRHPRSRKNYCIWTRYRLRIAMLKFHITPFSELRDWLFQTNSLQLEKFRFPQSLG